MQDSSFRGDSRGVRLDSWKAIAQHLGRSSRTAQRWHTAFGLPVHHLGGDSGSVFAYSDEIDHWFLNHRGGAPSGSPSKPSLVQMPARPASDKPIEQAQVPEHLNAPSRVRSQTLVADANKMWSLISEHNLHTIAQLFRDAIDVHPGNADAYAGLSIALTAQGMIGNITLSAAYSAACAASDKALEIDPKSSEAICAKAWLDMVCRRDWETARLLLGRALTESAPTTQAMVGRALLHLAECDCGAASDLLYSTSQENPLSSLSLGLHSWSDYLAGAYSEALDHIAQAHESGRSGLIFGAVKALTYAQFLPTDEAIASIKTLMEGNPRSHVVRGALGYLLGRNGDEEQARAILQSLNSRRSHTSETAHYAIALVHVGLDEREPAIERIERSFAAGSLWSLGFHLDPALQPLARDADFKQFVRRSYPGSCMDPQAEMMQL